MSVIVTIKFEGDPQKLEQYAAENREHLRRISDQATEHGLIAHRFYGATGRFS